MNLETLPSPLWVLGTDTHVGKTHVSSRIARAWAALGPVTYRKPFQTGVRGPEDPDGDAPAVGGPGIRAETHTILGAPLCPLAAAEAEGRKLDLEAVAAWCRSPWSGRLLLEGVGGIQVPLWDRVHFLAWATPFQWPCVLVGRGGLGTLNHVLLSAEALMMRGWRIERIILNAGVDRSQEAVEGNLDILRRLLPMPVQRLD